MKFIFSTILIFSFAFAGYSQPAESLVTEFDINGLKVIFKRRPSSPTVSVGLFTRGGVRNQTAQNAGIENLTLSAASESSKKFPREILRSELARTGTAIGGAAGYDFGGFFLTSTRRHFDRSWEIFTDVVLNPSFTAEDLRIVSERMLTALRNQSASPDSALDSLEEKTIYAGHPYSNDPLGTMETISNLKSEDLRGYHKNLIHTSRLLLVVVGDLEPQMLRSQVAASFGKLPRGDYKESPAARVNFAQPSVDVTPRNISTNYIKGIFSAPSLADPDYYAMRVAMAILQGRVYDEVRVRRNLSYAPNAEMGSHAANTAHIYVTSVDANQAVSVMLAEIEKMKKQSIEPEAFARVSGFFLTTYYINQETNAAQVRELAQYELVGGGWRNSFEFLNRISRVTASDIQSVSNRYMRNIRFVAVGNPQAINRSVFLQQ